MSRARRRLLAAAVGLAVGVGLFAALAVTAGSSGATVAPSFSLTALGGGPPVRMPVVDQGQRQPVVLVFFASWCTPCQKELPVVARTAAAITAEGAHVAFVGIDGNDAVSDGLAFARQSGVRFVVGEDPDSAVANRYGLGGFPDTVFVDAAGDVVHTVQGPVTAGVLRQWAQRIALPG